MSLYSEIKFKDFQAFMILLRLSKMTDSEIDYV